MTFWLNDTLFFISARLLATSSILSCGASHLVVTVAEDSDSERGG